MGNVTQIKIAAGTGVPQAKVEEFYAFLHHSPRWWSKFARIEVLHGTIHGEPLK